MRRIFLTTPQLDFASRLTSSTRKVSFRRSDSMGLRMGVSCAATNTSKYVNLVHKGMILPSMATFSQRFDSGMQISLQC